MWYADIMIASNMEIPHNETVTMKTIDRLKLPKPVFQALIHYEQNFTQFHPFEYTTSCSDMNNKDCKYVFAGTETTDNKSCKAVFTVTYNKDGNMDATLYSHKEDGGLEIFNEDGTTTLMTKEQADEFLSSQN